jgi:transposase-like protein
MRYSLAFKEKAIRRILPPNEETVCSVSIDMGVTKNSLYQWLKKAREGKLGRNGEVSPNRRGAKEKLKLLLEGKVIPAEQQGEWLRENGMHSEHLHQYEQEIREIVEEKSDKHKEETRRLKNENKELKKELQRKEKALAEMAALLTLKKKANVIWGDNEED